MENWTKKIFVNIKTHLLPILFSLKLDFAVCKTWSGDNKPANLLLGKKQANHKYQARFWQITIYWGRHHLRSSLRTPYLLLKLESSLKHFTFWWILFFYWFKSISRCTLIFCQSILEINQKKLIATLGIDLLKTTRGDYWLY